VESVKQIVTRAGGVDRFLDAAIEWERFAATNQPDIERSIMNEPRQITHIEEVKRQFTDEELLEKAKSIARVRADVERLEEEKKQASDSFKAQIEKREADIDLLCKNIREGYELVPTPCDVVLNRPTPGMKSLISQKTLEVVKTMPMTDTERQRSFFSDYEGGSDASAS